MAPKKTILSYHHDCDASASRHIADRLFSSERCRLPIVEVIFEKAGASVELMMNGNMIGVIACHKTYLEVCEKLNVVHQGQGVEDVKFELFGQHQCVSHELHQAALQLLLLVGGGIRADYTNICGIIIEKRDVQSFVLRGCGGQHGVG